MNEEMKNRTILVVTVVFLLITVIVMGFVFALRGEGKTKNSPKVSLKQVYSSEYKLDILNDVFFIGKYDKNLNVIIDNKGIEVVSNNLDVPYDGYYATLSGEYLFYKVANNNLTTYIFNGSTFLQKHTYLVNDSVKPIIHDDKIYGFSFIDGFKLHIIDINNAGSVVLNNLSLIGNYDSYLFVRNEENKVGVIDINGNVVLPFEYDSVVGTENGTFIVVVQGKNKLVDRDNNVLIDNCINIITSNSYYVVINENNKMALYDKDIKMLSKFEMKYSGDSVDVYSLDTGILVAQKDYFYFVNGSVKKYDGSIFKYNNSYAYYLKNIVYMIDDNVNVVKEISFGDESLVSDVKVSPYIISVKILVEDNVDYKVYDYDFNSIKAKDNIVYRGNEFFVYLNNKDDLDELIITDLRNNVVQTITGKKILVSNEFVLIDGDIYKIVAE